MLIAMATGAIGFASAVHSADQPTWRVESPTYTYQQVPDVVPLSDGGAIILSPLHMLGRHAWHLDADLQLHPQGLVPANVYTLGEVLTSSGPLLVGERYTGSDTCRRFAGAIASRELRLVDGGQEDYVDELPFVATDGRFGHFSEYEFVPGGEPIVRILRSDHDCTPDLLFDTDLWAISNLTSLSDGSGAIALMHLPDGTQHTRVVRLDRNGIVWERTMELPDGTEFSPNSLTRLPGNNVLALGRGPGDASTILQRLDADGELRWTHTINESGLPPRPEVLQTLVHGETVILTFREGGFIEPPPFIPPRPPTHLVAINADGEEIARQPLTAAFSRLAQAPQRRHRPLYVSADQLMETTAAGRLEVIGPRDGALAELADGRLLRGAINPPRVWFRDDAGGEQAIEIPMPVTHPQSGFLRYGDGLGLVDVASSTGEYWKARVFDADGSLLWVWTGLQAEAITGEVVGLTAVHADETSVCLLLRRSSNMWLACFEREGGEPLGPVAHVADSPWLFQVWKRDTGIWLLGFREGRIVSRRLTGPDGPQPEQLVAGLGTYASPPRFLPLNDEHLLVVGCVDDWCRSRVVDTQGAAVLDLPMPWPGADVQIHRAPNGFLLSAYLDSNSPDRRLAMQRVDLASGSRWQQTLVPPADVHNTSTLGGFLQRDGRWIHWVNTRSGMHLAAFDDANGSAVWNQTRRERGDESACLSSNIEGPVGLITQRGFRLDVEWLDPVDGAVVAASAFEDVGEIVCPSFPVGDTGTALSAVGIETREVLRIDPPAQPTEAPDIAWMRGVWYDPGSSGQGFMLQNYPDQELMSGAWFTYASHGEHDRADQRWYTLQAATGSSKSSAVGTLYSSEGGRFGEPPAVSSVAVGSVELSMVSCDSALLSYRFNDPESHGQQGTMLLQRLVADAPECAAAPHAAASPSGSYWYDPATSGQGLYLQTIGGRAFGAWFTFDPADSADDPTAQHWFTLAGDAPLHFSSLPARIMRTIGGTLDDAATTNAAQIGEASLSLIDCETAQLDYQFNDPRYAAEFEGLEGSMSLRRIGGCETSASQQ